MEVHPEALSQASSQWSELLDTSSLPTPMVLPVYSDPASAAVATAMNQWPAIQESMTAKRNANADALVTMNHKTSAAFTTTDDGNAHMISSSVRPPLV
jgi:hypothetical protein